MIKYRVPTKDQYAFIEVDEEGEMTPDQIREAYQELYNLMNGVTPEAKFYSYLEELFNSNLTMWGSVDDYQELSPQQKGVMQAVKRYYKRLADKE